MSKKLLDYWRNPNDGMNAPKGYLTPRTWVRSVRLYDLLRDLIAPESNPKILELGCNVGRNLMLLHFGGYQCLTGIELNENAVTLMRRTFTDANKLHIQIGEIEKHIYDMPTESFDIIFTMAVLQHLPPESEHIFKEIIRVMKGYLVLTEDEKQTSWRHYPRRYDRVFTKLGIKQIKVVKNLDGLNKSFVCRIFEKEIEE